MCSYGYGSHNLLRLEYAISIDPCFSANFIAIRAVTHQSAGSDKNRAIRKVPKFRNA